MRLRTVLMPVAGIVAAVALAAPATAAPGPDNAQGQTEQGPATANSICSFSGLNDEPLDPVEGGRTQNFGHVVGAAKDGHIPGVTGAKDLKAAGEHPGLMCNGHLVPWQEVGG